MRAALRTLSLLPLVLAVSAAPLQGQDEPDANGASTLDRIYSDEQAQRGQELFDTECALCHAPSEFGGRIFRMSWTGRPVGALFSQIRTNMPLDRPGALDSEEYAAVVAYVLKLNGYPVGQEPLPADAEVLNGIRFVPPPEDGTSATPEPDARK